MFEVYLNEFIIYVKLFNTKKIPFKDYLHCQTLNSSKMEKCNRKAIHQLIEQDYYANSNCTNQTECIRKCKSIEKIITYFSKKFQIYFECIYLPEKFDANHQKNRMDQSTGLTIRSSCLYMKYCRLRLIHYNRNCLLD